MRIRRTLMCDFEARAGELAIAERKTWVWAWASCNIHDIDNAVSGTDIGSFMGYLDTQAPCLGYFHNLKFDGEFIVSFLLRDGYKPVNIPGHEKPGKGEFAACIAGTGQWYNIRWLSRRGKLIELRDSLKKIPGSVDRIGKSFGTKFRKTNIDYTSERAPGGSLTAQEDEYVKNDVRVVAEVLKTLEDEGMTKMTIGSDCLAYYQREFGGAKLFRATFPVLSDDEDAFARKAYRGGISYVNPQYAGRLLVNVDGHTRDVYSLYPSNMSSVPYEFPDEPGKKRQNLFPVGAPEYGEGEWKPTKTRPLGIQRFICHFKVKPGKVPFIQIKHNYLFGSNEFITDSKEIVELTLTSVDLEMFYDCYDIVDDYIAYLDYYAYKGMMGLFDGYMFHFNEQKSTSKGAKRQIAKLFMNNLYGKFGQKRHSSNKVPYLGEDGRVRYKTVEGDDRKPVYMPVAAFTTAYGRRYLIHMIHFLGDKFVYCDTDSVHYIGDLPKCWGTEISGWFAWEHESDWDSAIFVRQKTYMEHITWFDGEPCEPFYSVKCCGMNEATKREMIRLMTNGTMSWEQFNPGMRLLDENGEPVTLKLTPKHVDGGVLLVGTEFRMH